LETNLTALQSVLADVEENFVRRGRESGFGYKNLKLHRLKECLDDIDSAISQLSGWSHDHSIREGYSQSDSESAPYVSVSCSRIVGR